MLAGLALLIIDMPLREAIDRGFDCVTVGDACAAGDPEPSLSPTLQAP